MSSDTLAAPATASVAPAAPQVEAASRPTEPSQSGPASPAEEASLAISIRGVSKSYRIYSKPIDRLKQAFSWGRKQYYHDFWALRDVQFDVRRGEAVGIIGRNGSGKSTLLQIIAGTLTPTAGEVAVTGRVAALLELGSGFNPEFTGRENVFMNGAILGLSQREIQDRFAAIAAFADIGEFIEQPVKTYSSGMMMRLAFSVATCVDPDILIVDEALSVGDEAFQRKCFGWLERYRDGGGTVLFVTHGVQTVVRLCDRAVVLDRGMILAHGASKPVTDIYQKLLYGSAAQAARLVQDLAAANGFAERVVSESTPIDNSGVAPTSGSDESLGDRGFRGGYMDAELSRSAETVYGNGEAEISDIATFDASGRRANALTAGEPFELRYRVTFSHSQRGVRLGMMLKTIDGIDLFGVSSVHLGRRIDQVAAGNTVDVRFRMTLNVGVGTYFLNCGVSAFINGEEVYLHRRVDALALRVIPPDDRELYGLVFSDPSIEIATVRERRDG